MKNEKHVFALFKANASCVFDHGEPWKPCAQAANQKQLVEESKNP